MTKLRHRLKKRRHGRDIEAARHLRTSSPLVALPAEDLQTSNLHHTASHNKSSVVIGRQNDVLIMGGGGTSNGHHNPNGLVGGVNGLSNGRRNRVSVASSDRMLAGLCRTEEGRVKIFLKVATQDETTSEEL